MKPKGQAITKKALAPYSRNGIDVLGCRVEAEHTKLAAAGVDSPPYFLATC